MSKAEMAPWETDKQHVIYRIDQLDQRFEKFEGRFDQLSSTISKQNDQISALRELNSKAIDDLRVDILKIAMNFKSFKGEFNLKTSAWAFLGTATAILAGVLTKLLNVW